MLSEIEVLFLTVFRLLDTMYHPYCQTLDLVMRLGVKFVLPLPQQEQKQESSQTSTIND